MSGLRLTLYAVVPSPAIPQNMQIAQVVVLYASDTKYSAVAVSARNTGGLQTVSINLRQAGSASFVSLSPEL
jgi:hypothetical protein